MSKHPDFEPSRLTFDHQATYFRAGHLYVSAHYPSWSRHGTLHHVTVRDDGAAVACTCTGAQVVGRCYHLTAAPEIATEFRRREYRGLTNADLLREDSFLAHCPAGSLDAAQRLCLDAVGDVVAERYIARYGRVPEAAVGAA